MIIFGIYFIGVIIFYGIINKRFDCIGLKNGPVLILAATWPCLLFAVIL